MSKISLGVIVTSSYKKLSDKEISLAAKRLEKYFEVKLYLPTSGPNEFGSISIDQMVSLINKAASECEVLLSYSGGFNQVELLLQFDKLKFRPDNMFVGQSDNTLLVNVLPALGVCKSLYGKGFYNMATNADIAEEMVEELYQSIMALKEKKSSSQDPVLIGGNNYTFDLLQGTRFSPKFDKPFVLFIEGEDILKDSSEVWVDFIRNIDSVILQKGALKNLRGLIIGEFPDSIKVTKKQFDKFVQDRDYLKDIPIVRGYACGHYKGSLKYLPIGEKISIKMLNLN